MISIFFRLWALCADRIPSDNHCGPCSKFGSVENDKNRVEGAQCSTLEGFRLDESWLGWRFKSCTLLGFRPISVIPFTAKREHDTTDTWFHLLENTTVKNMIDCTTRRVTRFLNRFSFPVINSLFLTSKSDSIIDCKTRIQVIDWKTRIQLYLQNLILLTAKRDYTRFLKPVKNRVFNCIVNGRTLQVVQNGISLHKCALLRLCI